MGDEYEELSADELGATGIKSAPALSFTIDGAKEGDIEVAFARTGVVDSHRHLTDAGAFPKGKTVPMSAYGHASWPDRGGRLPTGIVEIGEKADLATATGRFLIDTQHGKDTYLTVKALGKLQEWSYGYKILAGRKEKADDGPIIRVSRMDVREVSPVLVGAGDRTATLGIKADEEGPLAGLPYADHVERVLLDVGELVGRAKSLRELRVKAGRELSETNRGKLIRLRDSIAALDEMRAEVEELLSRTDPEAVKDAPETLRLFAEYERTRSRLAGVAVSVGG